MARSGEMFVDNDPGNGVGEGTVLVAIDPHGAASVASPPLDTLPAVGAPGFSRSEYPPARSARGQDLSACPSNEGLEAFDSSTTLQAEGIAAEFNSKSLALDLEGADRAWWQGDFASLQSDGDGGAYSVLSVVPASADTFSSAVTAACGESLVRESLVVDVGASDYSGEISHLYLLDRSGHPLVYFQAS